MKINEKQRRATIVIGVFAACAWTIPIRAEEKPLIAAQTTTVEANSTKNEGEKKSSKAKSTKNEERTAPAIARLESLDVRASKAIYQGGEAVLLDVSLLNKSAKATAFLMLGPNLEFKIKREGKIVGLTRKGREDSKGDKVSYRSAGAGGKIAYVVVLNRLFDLSRAGNYVVSCTKYLKNDNRDPGADLVGPRLISQDVKFSVSESDVLAGKF